MMYARDSNGVFGAIPVAALNHRKIEELTLHLIEQNKTIADLKEKTSSPDPLGKKVEELTLLLIRQ